VQFPIGVMDVITAFSGSASELKKFTRASSALLPTDMAQLPGSPS